MSRRWRDYVTLENVCVAVVVLSVAAFLLLCSCATPPPPLPARFVPADHDGPCRCQATCAACPREGCRCPAAPRPRRECR